MNSRLRLYFLFFSLAFSGRGSCYAEGHASADTAELRKLIDRAQSFMQTNHDSCAKYADLALVMAREAHIDTAVAQSLILKGGTLSRRGKNPEALPLFFEALAISEKIPDSARIAACYNWIGSAYLDQKNWEPSLKYYQLYLSVAEALGNKYVTANAHNNLGTTYHESGQLDLGLQHYQKAAALYDELKETRMKAATLTSIGIIYSQKGNFEKAKEYQELGLEITTRAGNKVFMCVCFAELGAMYFRHHDYAKAIAMHKKALGLSEECDYTEGRKSALEGLVKVYGAMNDYRQGYESFVALTSIKDSLFNESSSRQIADVSAKYETAQKEKKIAELKEQAQAQKLKSFMKTATLVGIFSLSAIISLFLFLRFRRHQKKIRVEAVQSAEHNERARISRDMHDELGSGLTKFVHLAEMTKNPAYAEGKLSQDMNSIAQSASSLVGVLDDLVWSINPENSGLDYLTAKIRSHINECEENSEMKFEFELPDKLPDYKLKSDAKKNIYLFSKEAVSNAMKHSGGTEVITTFGFTEKEMHVSIKDNGRGFHLNGKEKTRHGLGNMRHRIESIGGVFTLHPSEAGSGTIVSAILPLEKILSE